MSSARLRLLLSMGAVALAACAAGCAGDTNEEDAASNNDDSAALSDDWTPVSAGVAYKNTGDGAGVFIGYAGYSVKDTWSCAWTSELHRVRLKALGVGHLYCVRGPKDASYAAHEIGNSGLAAHLVSGPAGAAPFIFVAAHSSGHYVATELLNELYAGAHPLDASGVTDGKIVYADLDGGSNGLPTAVTSKLMHLAFVWAQDPGLGSGLSANAGVMQSAGAEHGDVGIGMKVAHSGCSSGARWCLHDLLITTRPHNPNAYDLGDDYTDFVDRPIQVAYIDTLAPILRAASSSASASP